MTRRFAAGQGPQGALAAMVAILGALLSACEGDTITSLRPELTLDPAGGSTLTFDEVVLGRNESGPRSIKVGNIGDGVLNLEEPVIEGLGAASFRVTSAPRSLSPGQSRNLVVRFSPTAPAPQDAVLVLRTNDPTQAEVRFPLVGPAREACRISAGPAHQVFLLGEVREVTISADSTHPCTITRLFTDRSLFEILDEPELPLTLQPGQPLVLQVEHIATTTQPGVPVRELRVKESEGTEAVITFEGEPPVYGCFRFFPDRLVYPTTPVGVSVQQSVRVANECGREAAVTSVAISTGFYYFSVERAGYPQIVPPGGSIFIPVTWVPFSPLGDIGRLRINTNDSANPRFSVDLYGTAAQPNAEIFPSNLDFGTVIFRSATGPGVPSECASRAQVVQIYSTGQAPLNISRIALDPAGDPDFRVVSVTVDGVPVDYRQPVAVPPDSQMRIALQFYPTRSMPGEHLSRLLITHNGSEGARPVDFEVNLTGEGAPDGATTDVFQQLEGPKVDILWVIDNSCSMYDEQARLINNLSQFVSYADTQVADYQMAVTDTEAFSPEGGKFRRCLARAPLWRQGDPDPCDLFTDAGQQRYSTIPWPPPAIISRSYPENQYFAPGLLALPPDQFQQCRQWFREQAFECAFNIGTNGSGEEAGLQAAMRGLERATDATLDPGRNPNLGFIRDDAKLAVVVMSDEEDHSIIADQVMRDYFFSVKGAHRPDRVKLHAIAGPVTMPCQLGERFAEPGYRYRWMTQQTSGIFFDICQEDWQPVLRQLGLDTFQPEDEWDLSQAADPGSLMVTVGGQPVLASPLDGYTYNPVGNSIQFHGSSVPTPGEEIVVSYVGLCRP